MNNKNEHAKKLTCMNSDVESSKWWKYAPLGGCNEVVSVDVHTEKVLCWKCTLRSTGSGK